MNALTDEVKATIQEAYRAWLAAREFKPRRGQREMVAHIARTLTDPEHRITAVEAGTGTGKTAAYCIATIPVARALGKTVVISTATVALQEQVVLRDLPDLKRHADLEFNFALAKGRGRYVCLKRLDDALRATDQAELLLFDATSEDATPVYQAMLAEFGSGAWDGELDSWAPGVDADVWRGVTTDHRGCSNRRCPFFKQCPFFKARARLDGIEVIIANHDLVLADLSLGGGVVLPPPEDVIYIMDEAHHLPDKTQNHFAVRMRMQGTLTWLDQVNASLGTITQRFSRPDALVALSTSLAEQTALAGGLTNRLRDCVEQLPFEERDEDLQTHRFGLGQIDQGLQEICADALTPVQEIVQILDRAESLLEDVASGDLVWSNAHEADDFLPVLGQHSARVGALAALLANYAAAPLIGTAPDGRMHARWANRYEADYELISAPIEPGYLLQEVLWQRCFAAVCTSATLTAVGRWDRFLERCGLQEASVQAIPSPFDYPRISELVIPDMNTDPRDFDGHTEEVADLLPDLLASARSALVLFTSWRQMRRVIEQLPDLVQDQLLVQGDGSKQQLLDEHRLRIGAGKNSYLAGLASFAEGVDLPDDYCRHVIIVKVPFAVPDDPIDQAMAEWAEHRGRNAFYDISVPDAALKLVQACGRLIRHEGDHGRITLLDRRVVTQRYGEQLLRSLPPYRRVRPA